MNEISPPAPWVLKQSPAWPFELSIEAADGRTLVRTSLPVVDSDDASAAQANARPENAPIVHAVAHMAVCDPSMFADVRAQLTKALDERNPLVLMIETILGIPSMSDADLETMRTRCEAIVLARQGGGADSRG